MSYRYIMYNSRRIRPFTKHIILTHLPNLIEDFYIDPSAVTHNNYFTAGILEEYFMRYLKKPQLPYHYYIDNIGDDWFSFKGLAEFQPSYYIEDLVQAGVLKYEYLNSMLIVISDDYSRFTVDKRMSEKLCHQVLTDLERRYNLTFDKIHYIDDCLSENWEENLKMSNLKYNYLPAKYFDFQQIKINLNKFKKN